MEGVTYISKIGPYLSLHCCMNLAGSLFIVSPWPINGTVYGTTGGRFLGRLFVVEKILCTTYDTNKVVEAMTTGAGTCL